jgi:type II secretory pathway component PulL
VPLYLTNEDPLICLEVVADDLQHADMIRFAAQSDLVVPHSQLKEAGQKIGVVVIRAMGRVKVTAGARMYADTSAFCF